MTPPAPSRGDQVSPPGPRAEDAKPQAIGTVPGEIFAQGPGPGFPLRVPVALSARQRTTV